MIPTLVASIIIAAWAVILVVYNILRQSRRHAALISPEGEMTPLMSKHVVASHLTTPMIAAIALAAVLWSVVLTLISWLQYNTFVSIVTLILAIIWVVPLGIATVKPGSMRMLTIALVTICVVGCVGAMIEIVLAITALAQGFSWETSVGLAFGAIGATGFTGAGAMTTSPSVPKKKKKAHGLLVGMEEPYAQAKGRSIVAIVDVRIAEAKGLGPWSVWCSLLIDGDEAYRTNSIESEEGQPMWGESCKIACGCMPGQIKLSVRTEADEIIELGHVIAAEDDVERWTVLSGGGEGMGIRARVTVRHIEVAKVAPVSELIASRLVEERGMKAMKAMSEHVSARMKDSFAEHLVALGMMRGKIEAMLVWLCIEEVKETKQMATLFRANSLGTKSMDRWMQSIGRDYLVAAVSSTVESALALKESVEPDLMKIVDEEVNLEKRWNVLNELGNEALEGILSCPVKVPAPLIRVLSLIGQAAEEKFGLGGGRTVVVNFVFLRLLCPALLGPGLFGLGSKNAGEDSRRALTLIAKCVQNSASGIEFGMKEAYMAPMNEGVLRKHTVRMSEFFESIVRGEMIGDEVPKVGEEEEVHVASFVWYWKKIGKEGVEAVNEIDDVLVEAIASI